MWKATGRAVAIKAGVWEVLSFAAVVSFFFFFQRVISEVPRPNTAKLCHMLGSECNLRNSVRDFSPRH